MTSGSFTVISRGCAEHSDYERSRVVVLPVPYDSTARDGWGSREGPAAIVDASGNMELYQHRYRLRAVPGGNHTMPKSPPTAGARRGWPNVSRRSSAVDRRREVRRDARREHTVASGRRERMRSEPPDSRVGLDATQTCGEYLAIRRTTTRARCAASRKWRQLCRWGLRSAEREEHEYIREQGLRFYSRASSGRWARAIAEQLSESVYVTFDLDAFRFCPVVSALGRRTGRAALGRGERPAGDGQRRRRSWGSTCGAGALARGAAGERAAGGEAGVQADRAAVRE